MVGTRPGRYRIIDRIGGGKGVVCIAEGTGLQRRVALQFLPEEVSKNPHALERFQRDARTASAVNHPRNCAICDIDKLVDRAFIAMESPEGRTRRERIARNWLKTDDSQLINALTGSHFDPLATEPGCRALRKKANLKW